MDDMFADQPVTVREMRECAERELAMRERVYPAWVAKERMPQHKADHELRVMRAIIAHFRAMERPREIEQSAPPMPETPMLGGSAG